MAGPDIVTNSDGRQMYRLQIELQWAYPFDPDSPMTLLWAPMGGIGTANLPFMLTGPAGKSSIIQEGGDVTFLEHDDPTADSWELVEVSPATDSTPQVLKVVAVLHKAAPGAAGTSLLDPDAYGTKVAGRILELYLDGSDWKFRYTPQKVGGMYWPGVSAVTEVAAGTGSGKVQVDTITIAANTIPFDWRPEVQGTSIVSATTTDTVVDLTARIGTTSGTIVGKAKGIGGLVNQLTLVSGPVAGTDPSTYKIAANAAATLLLVTEKQGGAGTYGTGIVGESYLSFVAVPVP